MILVQARKLDNGDPQLTRGGDSNGKIGLGQDDEFTLAYLKQEMPVTHMGKCPGTVVNMHAEFIRGPDQR